MPSVAGSNRTRRVLAVERLSRESDESSSIRRQREHMNRWVELGGHVLVDHAEDSDVSGAVSPFDRDGLGPWLTDERAKQYDTLAAIKIDRLSRSLVDFVKLIEWCDAHGITVVAIEEGVDTSTPTGRLMAHLLGVFAEFERQRIRERSMDSQRDALRNGYWHGGTPPWGYVAVKGADAKWRLVPDAEYLPVVREAVERVLDGESCNSIATDLNERDVPTSEDRHNQRSGNPLGSVKHVEGCPDAKEQTDDRRMCACPRLPYRWSAANLGKMLRSRSLLGETVDTSGDVKLRDEQGMPVMRAEPLISETEWKRVQDALASRKLTPRRSRMVSPLSGLLRCGVCNQPYYRFTDNRGVDRYRCRSATGEAATTVRCGNPSIVGTALTEAITEIILNHIGNEPVTRRVFVRGSDQSGELERVSRAINDLRDDADAGLFPDRGEYRRRMAALLERQATLAALPNEPDHWINAPTGQTFRERWEATESDDERRNFLLSTGAKFTLTAHERAKPSEGTWTIHMDRGDIHNEYLVVVHKVGKGESVVSVGRPLRRKAKSSAA